MTPISSARPSVLPQAEAVRRLPVGVEPLSDGVADARSSSGAHPCANPCAHARVWAPRAGTVALVTEPDGAEFLLEREPGGYFSGTIAGVAAGTCYRFRLDGGDRLYPDPASRFQPEGPHGASQVVDPDRFAWTDAGWAGRPLRGQVIYEMHIGTFTPEGTWDAAMRELPALAELGVTVLELMPVAEFPGRFGWGYDGVNLFAPTRLYGGPDDMRRFVDRAHALGLAVILDVVYNHFGPDGNYLNCFAEAYFTDRYKNEWGEPINFDGPDSGPVREFFIANAAYWIREFHLDGLRLDATQQIFDASEPHILAEIGRAVRAAAGGRSTILVGENEPQLATMVRPTSQGGYGLDAIWNDDLHHSAMVALTGRSEAYYSDYRGTPQELVSAIRHGFLYQGQWYRWQRQPRGMPATGMPHPAFVAFTQNHDQIANSASGRRGHQLTSPGRWRAIAALILLGPGTPMLFQGQEFSASAPFLYFADHKPELAAQVEQGRAAFLRQFPSIAAPESGIRPARPHDEASFRRCKLDHRERQADVEAHSEAWALHRDLLRLRREDPVFAAQGDHGIDGAVLAEEAFVLRFFGQDGNDRLLLVNLGRDLTLDILPEPLLAPPLGGGWRLHWSSEHASYGGGGQAAGRWREAGWRLPAHAALVLRPADPTSDGPAVEERHG